MTNKSSDVSTSQSIAFDTTTYSHLVRGNKEAAVLLQSAKLVIMPLSTIVELKSGFAFGSRQQENEAQLTRFLASDKVFTVFPDEVTGDYYVALFAHARRKGRQLSHNDIWIAASAVQHGSKLVTFDHDFDGVSDFKGLRLIVLENK
jgi:tRNA(fMet)-specific endonuclease VapC